jgi:hypothetical protein
MVVTTRSRTKAVSPSDDAAPRSNRSLVVRAPIRASSSVSPGTCALVLGLFLVLYTPLWMALLSYKDTLDEGSSMPTRFLFKWILEFTPWLANAVLSIFLGGLFLYLGWASVRGIDK